MNYTIIKTIGSIETSRKAVVKSYRQNPGNFDVAVHAAYHYAVKAGTEMVVIPGNSYGNKVYRITTLADDFSKYKPGCPDGIGAIITPYNTTVTKVKFS